MAGLYLQPIFKPKRPIGTTVHILEGSMANISHFLADFQDDSAWQVIQPVERKSYLSELFVGACEYEGGRQLEFEVVRGNPLARKFDEYLVKVAVGQHGLKHRQRNSDPAKGSEGNEAAVYCYR